MAEIDHPRLDRACASTSSLLENMNGGLLVLTGVGTVSVGESPLGLVDLYGPTTPLKGEELQ